MRKIPCLALFAACPIMGCSDPHVFEVDVRETRPRRAELTLHNVTTSMDRTARGFAGRRHDPADGSGRIVLTYAGDGRIICYIGYVSNGELEPHRFVVKDGRCVEL